MSKSNPKILIIATSRKTRGGITSVIKAHQTGEQWEKFHCRWIETHRDGNLWIKVWYISTALLKFIALIPFYDIVHIHLATGLTSANRKLIFFIMAKFLHKKIIFHFHPSNEKYLFEKKNKKILFYLFSKSDLVLVLSSKWKELIRTTLNLEENIRVLYNPCPQVIRSYEPKKTHILFAGSIIPRKGYDTLLKAFARIAKKHPDWKIIFAGNGEIYKAQQVANNLEIIKQVQFLGWVSGQEKERAFQEASIYCLPSIGEGFPMGLLDAWAYGIPCVVTPVGGIPEIVTHEKNGLIFPIDDFNELSAQLTKLIEHRELRKTIVKNSDVYVTGIFNINNINKRLDKIYSSINNVVYIN
jgi:glycosyltransferase involved in cell wall biosynthesis